MSMSREEFTDQVMDALAAWWPGDARIRGIGAASSHTIIVDIEGETFALSVNDVIEPVSTTPAKRKK